MRIFHIIDVRIFEDKNKLAEALKSASNFRLEKYNAINNQLSKLQVLANTYLLDKCLKEIGLTEKGMEYGIEKNGKLYFKNVANIHFNLSHSKNMSLAVISDVPVGCDIQYVDKLRENILDVTLSESEKAEVLSEKNVDMRNEKFYTFWAMKEASIKKDGSGLRNNLTDVDISDVYVEKYILDVGTEKEKYIIAIK